MTPAEHHKAVIDAFNRADWASYQELVGDATYSELATGRALSGDDLMELVKGWRAAFPDLTGTVTSSVESGNTVAQEITWVGTHTGPMQTPEGELPPTGNSMTVPAAVVATYDNDRLTRFNHYFDMLGILRAAGAA